jgi:hypothetical protein
VSTRYFLIEHSEGLFCCHLRAVGGAVLVPVSEKLSYGQVELQRSKETRLIGVVDLALRPALRFDPPEVPAELACQWKPRPLSRDVRSAGALLRNARVTMRISLREASEMSRSIANTLMDDRHYVSPSSLCDYELRNTAPRRIQTAITLCSLYGLPLQTLLQAMGIGLEETGTEPMPDQFAYRVSPASSHESQHEPVERGGFLEHLLERSEEILSFCASRWRNSPDKERFSSMTFSGSGADRKFFIPTWKTECWPWSIDGGGGRYISHPSRCTSNRYTYSSSVTARICAYAAVSRAEH